MPHIGGLLRELFDYAKNRFSNLTLYLKKFLVENCLFMLKTTFNMKKKFRPKLSIFHNFVYNF